MSSITPTSRLNTLIERWQEVADAYKNDPPRDDNDRTYHDYRHIYLRNIRDLRHVLDTGRMPCSLMNDEERRRGDCGRNHEDDHDAHGQGETRAATASIPEPVRRVITERLADMLLSRQDDGWGAEQARRFAFALKDEGADLTADIEKRIRNLTLGPDPTDPPF